MMRIEVFLIIPNGLCSEIILLMQLFLKKLFLIHVPWLKSAENWKMELWKDGTYTLLKDKTSNFWSDEAIERWYIHSLGR